jgi:ABC-2 type transport system ATP-binding protein
VRTATGVPPTLDDVFLALTGRTLREAGETADATPASEHDASVQTSEPTTETAGAQR